MLYTDPVVHGADAIFENSGGLFALRCWTHLSFNAGSGLPLYDWSIQGDGYRVERQPGLLNDLANLLEPEFIKRFAPLTSNLTSMTCIVFFPSDMMTQDLIRVVNGIKTPKHLSLRLVPGELSKAPSIDHCGLNTSEINEELLWDQYNDFFYVLNELLVTSETLESCSFLDWANNRDLNDIIDDGIDHERLQEEIGWKYDGAGVWTRDRDAKP